MKQGEIVLVPFPFTNNPAKSKKRPAIIVSNGKANKQQDVVLAAITSNIRNDSFSYFLDDTFLSTPMVKNSEVRCHKLFTMSKRLIIKKISYLQSDKQKELFKKICKALDPQV